MCSKPLAWLSYEINKAYIAQNLCENVNIIPTCAGKCYLGKQLIKIDQQDQNSENSKTPSTKSVHAVDDFCFDTNFSLSSLSHSNIIFIEKSLFNPQNDVLISNYHSDIFHPPLAG